MSRFVKPQVTRIDLGTRQLAGERTVSEWVEIRTQLTYRQRQELNGAIIDADVSSGEYKAKADLGQYHSAILRAFVTGWQIYEDDGTLVAFSPAALDLLDEETGDFLIKAIDEQDKTRQGGKVARST